MKARNIVFCLLLISWIAPLEAAPFLEGHVTDEQSRPVEGASVKIWDCVGTCLGGVTVLTDRDGHYLFPEKPFRNSPLLAVSMPGRFEVSRQHSGAELHEPDTDVARKADFVLGTPAAASVRLAGDCPKGWKQTLIFRSGRDAKVHRYDINADPFSSWGEGNFELLPRNENLHLVVMREPIPEPSDDPKEKREREQQAWKNRIEIVSPAIRLKDPQRYTVKTRLERQTDSDSLILVVESITDVLGADRTKELAIADPMFGSPVDSVAREQALALLGRVKEAAKPWIADPSKEIRSYEYDFVDATGKTTHVHRDQDSPSGPSWNDISRKRGFAYAPSLQWLFSQPDNVSFHKVTIGEDQAELRYRLKSQRGLGAGLGIGPGWNGFFTTSFSIGTIVIDVKSATVLEHRVSNTLLGQESMETFRDYLAVDQGYAPQSIRIQSGSQDFRLTFKIHNDKLWLMDKASRDDPPHPCCKIENVVVVIAE